MANACLVLFCGLPGAGKSTFAAKLHDILTNSSHKNDVLLLEDNKFVGVNDEGQKSNEALSILNNCHVLYICFDDIIPDNLYTDTDDVNLHRSRFETTWKSCRACIAVFLDKFLSLHCDSTSQGDVLENERLGLSEEWDYVYNRVKEDKFCNCRENIIKHRMCGCTAKHIFLLDDNMFYSSMRYKYYQMARKYCTGFLQIYISCDKDVLMRQNSERAAAVSLQTIEHMSSVFEVPDPQRNYWEYNFIEVNPTNADIESKLCDVLEMMAYSLQSPVSPLEQEDTIAKEETRKINLKSILHQTDQVLRKFIASNMKELQGVNASKECLQAHSSSLNMRKRSFMDALKRSNRTLKALDDLLFHQYQNNFKPVALEDIDLPDNSNFQIQISRPIDNTTGIPLPSPAFHITDQFTFTVSNLFQHFKNDFLP